MIDKKVDYNCRNLRKEWKQDIFLRPSHVFHQHWNPRNPAPNETELDQRCEGTDGEVPLVVLLPDLLQRQNAVGCWGRKPWMLIVKKIAIRPN